MSAAPMLAEANAWQRIRRLAVPARMIAECADARARGDWRAACAAARVDVGLDLAAVRRAHGAEAAAAVEADLAALAPDLLRWHLPRALGGRTSLATHQELLLSTRDGRFDKDDVALVVYAPRTVDGSQRLRLAVRPVYETERLRTDLPAVFWSHAHVGGLAVAHGGSAAGLPGFRADGSVRPFDDYRTDPDSADPAAASEAVERLIADGELVAAWSAARVELNPPDEGEDPDRWAAMAVRIRPGALPAELDRLHARYGTVSYSLVAGKRRIGRIARRGGQHPVAKITDDYTSYRLPTIAPVVVARPVDLELVRSGRLDVSELHPLIRSALFPALFPVAGHTDAPSGTGRAGHTDAPGGRRRTGHTDAPASTGHAGHTDAPGATTAVPVRCRGQWHTVIHGGGRLSLPAHPDDEVRREEALRALGGEPHGCFAVAAAWRTTGRWLPRRLRELRQDALLRIQHGGARAATELLDAGLDPHVVDGRGGTLLHHLRAIDHTEVLPRLLAAGVPVNARDRRGRTPLHVAIGDGGTAALIRALLEAGADLKARDGNGVTPEELAGYKFEGYYETDDDDDPRRAAMIEIVETVKGWPDR